MTRILLVALAFVLVAITSALMNRWRYGTGDTGKADRDFAEDWKNAGLPGSSGKPLM
jgi:hypothetical protein